MQVIESLKRVVIVWRDDGTLQGAHEERLRRIVEGDGTPGGAVELPPRPIALDSPRLAEVMGVAQAAALAAFSEVVATRDDLAERLAAAEGRLQALTAERDAANAERIALQAAHQTLLGEANALRAAAERRGSPPPPLPEEG